MSLASPQGALSRPQKQTKQTDYVRRYRYNAAVKARYWNSVVCEWMEECGNVAVLYRKADPFEMNWHPELDPEEYFKPSNDFENNGGGT